MKTYICIDLKSFYASVECVERNLDPLDTNLVVADNERTEKTICLAVTPSLKEYGLKGRSRLFEVVAKVNKINQERKKECKRFKGKSYSKKELKNKNLELDYIIAKPQMAKYMKYSAQIYNIYLKYISKDDIYVYSIDEIFADITNYLSYYEKTPEELVGMIIKDVYETTGITATAGIGPNLFLCKIAMDIVAKHKEPNEIGVRIATLDVDSYRQLLWNHLPITDFWRIGPGISKRLENYQIKTMGDIARTSIENEDLLYKILGINAELVIDHAWGYEPTTISDIKNIKPKNRSITQGQVLHSPYNYKDALIIIEEMAELLALDLTEKKLSTDMLVLHVCYDKDNIDYDGELVKDKYGRLVPKPSHGTIRTKIYTQSSKIIREQFKKLYEKITDPSLMIRKVNLSACNLKPKEKSNMYEQVSLFENNESIKKEAKEDEQIKLAMLKIKHKYGKNAILKGMNLQERATTRERNRQIGGHHE